MLENSAPAFAKVRGWSNQADDQIAVSGKVIKVARMHEHCDLTQQIDREVFVGLSRWHSKDNIPTALDIKSLTGFLVGELAIQFPSDWCARGPAVGAGSFCAARAAWAWPVAGAHSSKDRYLRSLPAARELPSCVRPAHSLRPRRLSFAANRKSSITRSA